MKKYYELVKLHKLKFGLTEFFVMLAAVIYIVGYPLLASAVSATCERQTLSYGTVRAGWIRPSATKRCNDKRAISLLYAS